MMETSEMQAAQAVWKLVEPDIAHHGLEILVRLFDKYPETKAKFPRLNVTTPEEARKSLRVRAHAGRVAMQLGYIIQHLNDMELVNETIFLMGENHSNRGVTRADFEKFFTVFLEYLKDTLSDALTEDATAAYKKVISIFNTKMAEQLDC